MTKYILHGGCVGRKTEDNKKFFAEITNGLAEPVRILCIYYAKINKNKWKELFGNDKVNFLSATPQKKLIFIMASEDANIFKEQIKNADVIYMRGGDSTHVLKEYLEKINNLETLWRGKVVAGSSAGAIVLAKYYYENDDKVRPYSNGLGILPIKAFSHYSQDQHEKLKQLKEYGENVKNVYTIPAEKFFIIEQ